MAFRVFFTLFTTASKRIELQKPDWTTFEALSQSFQKLSQFLKFYANEYVLLEQQKCVFFIDLSSKRGCTVLGPALKNKRWVPSTFGLSRGWM